MDTDRMLNTREAAIRLNRSTDWTRRRIKDGTLDGWQDASGFWHVTRESVEALKDKLIRKKLKRQAYRP